MEIEGEDGSRVQLRAGSEAVFGRGSGFRSADRTVSRRHVLFRAEDRRTEPGRVSFEVLGRNPVWVRSGGGGEVRVYRTSEKGELAAGDWLCASGRRPVWFAVKAIDGVRDLGSDSEAESESSYIPEKDIDPVKEFGFLVIGREFDRYPKQMLRKAEDWNWFLEEPKKDSSEDEDEDEDEKTKLKSGKRKKGKRARGHGGDGEDEDWTGESEEEKEDLLIPAKARKQTYSTRSKDQSLPSKRRRGGAGKSVQHRPSGSRGEDDAEEDEDDEEDETLGGFIVNDDDIEREEEGEGDAEEEEEVEEFIEDEED